MQKYLPYFAMVVVNLIYALNFSIAKEVTPHAIAPDALVVLRLAVCWLVVWFLGFFEDRPAVKKTDFLRFFAVALVSAVAMAAYIQGVGEVAPINGAIIYTFGPIFVVLISYFVFKEKLPASKWIGIILGFLGALALVLFGAKFAGKTYGTLRGDVLMFVGTTTHGLYLILVRPLAQKYTSLQILKVYFGLATLMLLPLGYKDLLLIDWANFSLQTWFALAYVVFAATLFTFFTNNYTVKHVGSSVTALFIFTQPLFAALYAQLMGKDEMNTFKLLCGATICLGLYLVTRQKNTF